MGTAYSNSVAVDATADTLFSIPFPSRCKIHRFEVELLGGGAFNLNLYNRNLSSDAIPIERIEDNGSGDVRIWLEPGVELPSVVNDRLTVAGSSVGGYNTDHYVTGTGTVYRTPQPTGNLRDQQNYIDTAESYTADATGGTATRNLEFLGGILINETADIAASGGIASLLAHTDGDEVEFVNRDPIGARNIGVNRKLYATVSATGSYQIDFITEDLIGN